MDFFAPARGSITESTGVLGVIGPLPYSMV